MKQISDYITEKANFLVKKHLKKKVYNVYNHPDTSYVFITLTSDEAVECKKYGIEFEEGETWFNDCIDNVKKDESEKFIAIYPSNIDDDYNLFNIGTVYKSDLADATIVGELNSFEEFTNKNIRHFFIK